VVGCDPKCQHDSDNPAEDEERVVKDVVGGKHMANLDRWSVCMDRRICADAQHLEPERGGGDRSQTDNRMINHRGKGHRGG
jgi:hypothetical protein